jgi:hypothetical protein
MSRSFPRVLPLPPAAARHYNSGFTGNKKQPASRRGEFDFLLN